MGEAKANNKVKSLLLKYAAFQHKHWLIYLLIVRLSAIWFSLVFTYLGEPWHLTKITDVGSKQPTILGWIATAVIFSIIIIGEIAVHIEGSVYDVKYYERGYVALGKLRSRINRICQTKKQTLLLLLKDIKSSKKTSQIGNIPQIISNPRKQLETIVVEMANCLADFLSESTGRRWQPSDLFVSIAYEFPCEGNEWHWATEEQGLSLCELLEANDPQTGLSTFSYILSVNSNSVFFNSKEEALKDKKYVKDGLDETDNEGHLCGSIACFKRALKKDDKIYIRYVLTITSYSRQFVTDNSVDAIDNTKHNMRELVLSDFFERINVELCLLYLDYLGGSS